MIGLINPIISKLQAEYTSQNVKMSLLPLRKIKSLKDSKSIFNSSILQTFIHIININKRWEIKVLLINLECMYTAMSSNSWKWLSLKHFISLIAFHQYMIKKSSAKLSLLVTLLFSRGFVYFKITHCTNYKTSRKLF